MKIVAGLVFLLGLVYLLLPGPQTIDDFSRLPISTKSELAGDTIQNPNIAAYYSNYDRAYVTQFYQQDLKNNYCNDEVMGFPNPLCFIPPIKLNHPPEEAFTYIRDQEESTYLEEYLYPLRESLFVNGYEPIDKTGKKFNSSSVPLLVDGLTYFSKATIRYYPTPIWERVLVYLLIWISIWAMWVVGKKALRHE